MTRVARRARFVRHLRRCRTALAAYSDPVTSPRTGTRRVARTGAILGSVATASSLAHAAGGGGLPSPDTSALLLVVLLPFAAILTDRRLGPAAIALALTAGQFVAHLGMVLGTGSHALVASPGSGHLHGAAALVGLSPTADPRQTLNHGVVPDGQMMLAHVAATVLLTVALSSVEAWLWRLTALLPRRRPRPSTPRPTIRVPLGPVALACARPAPWLATAPGRGPPALI